MLTDAGALSGNKLAVDFRYNHLTQLPSAWWNLPKVVDLDIQSNRISSWPVAGVHRESVFHPVDGSVLGCGQGHIAPKFSWPIMERVNLGHNPLHGAPAREVLGSLAWCTRLTYLNVNNCSLSGRLRRQGPGLTSMVDVTDCLTSTWTQELGFPNLNQLLAADDDMLSLEDSAWVSLANADFERNSLLEQERSHKIEGNAAK